MKRETSARRQTGGEESSRVSRASRKMPCSSRLARKAPFTPWPFPGEVRGVVIVKIIAIHGRKETHQLEA